MSNVISVNEINNILNNITANEINKAAQEIFSGVIKIFGLFNHKN